MDLQSPRTSLSQRSLCPTAQQRGTRGCSALVRSSVGTSAGIRISPALLGWRRAPLTHGWHVLAGAEAIVPQRLRYPPQGLGTLVHLRGQDRVSPPDLAPPGSLAPGSSHPCCALMFSLENHLQGNISLKQVEVEMGTAAVRQLCQGGGARARASSLGTPLLVQAVEQLHGEGVESATSPEGLEGPHRPRRRAGSDLTAWLTCGGRSSSHNFPLSSCSLWN